MGLLGCDSDPQKHRIVFEKKFWSANEFCTQMEVVDQLTHGPVGLWQRSTFARNFPEDSINKKLVTQGSEHNQASDCKSSGKSRSSKVPKCRPQSSATSGLDIGSQNNGYRAFFDCSGCAGFDSTLCLQLTRSLLSHSCRKQSSHVMDHTVLFRGNRLNYAHIDNVSEH